MSKKAACGKNVFEGRCHQTKCGVLFESFEKQLADIRDSYDESFRDSPERRLLSAATKALGALGCRLTQSQVAENLGFDVDQKHYTTTFAKSIPTQDHAEAANVIQGVLELADSLDVEDVFGAFYEDGVYVSISSRSRDYPSAQEMELSRQIDSVYPAAISLS